MRPPTPVPFSELRSMLFSAASFRTRGVTYGALLEPAAGAGSAAGAGAACGGGAGSGFGAGGGGAAGGVVPPVPIRASSPPTETVTSSSAVMLISVPATGDGISVSTLSVETSTSGSSTSTGSPTFFSQRVTVPSVTDSPSSGISTG